MFASRNSTQIFTLPHLVSSSARAFVRLLRSASDNALRARRIVEDSTLVRRDECNAAMRTFWGARSFGYPMHTD